VKTLHVISPSECRAAGLGPPLDLVSDWPSAARAKSADYSILAAPIADLEEGDIPRLCSQLQILPLQLVLLDPVGEAEFDLPRDAKACLVARSVFRRYERSARLLALPPLVEDLGPSPDGAFAFDVAYPCVLSTGLETATYNALRSWAAVTPGSKGMSEREAGTAEAAAVRNLFADNTERQADGSFRTRGTAFSPGMYFSPLSDLKAMTKTRTFRVDAPCYNTKWREDLPVASFGGGAEPMQDADARRLVSNVYGARILTGLGEVPRKDLRASLARSRCGVAVSQFASIPSRLVEIAAAGRMAFLVGESVSPAFGKDISEWCTIISPEEVRQAGEFIDAALRRMSDDEIRAAGRAARSWFDHVGRPSIWARRLAEIL
jgi:hypothetical protein